MIIIYYYNRWQAGRRYDVIITHGDGGGVQRRDIATLPGGRAGRAVDEAAAAAATWRASAHYTFHHAKSYAAALTHAQYYTLHRYGGEQRRTYGRTRTRQTTLVPHRTHTLHCDVDYYSARMRTKHYVHTYIYTHYYYERSVL